MCAVLNLTGEGVANGWKFATGGVRRFAPPPCTPLPPGKKMYPPLTVHYTYGKNKRSDRRQCVPVNNERNIYAKDVCNFSHCKVPLSIPFLKPSCIFKRKKILQFLHFFYAFLSNETRPWLTYLICMKQLDLHYYFHIML